MEDIQALALLRGIVAGLQAQDDTLLSVFATQIDHTDQVVKVYLEPGQWAFYRPTKDSRELTLIFHSPADLPNLFYRTTGKHADGYEPVHMTADERYVDNCFKPKTYYRPNAEPDWLVQEYVTERDLRGFLPWPQWTEEERHDFLDKRFPGGDRYMSVSMTEVAALRVDAQAHRQLLKDLEALGYDNFEQVMTVLKNNRVGTLVEREFDIWVEGYAATGEHSPARFLGKARGYNFRSACIAYIDSLDEHKRKDWNEDRTAIWGCRLFDNEAAARKSYG